MSMIATGGSPEPRNGIRVFFALATALLATSLLLAGGLSALQTAAILSAALMLDFLGEGDAATRIRRACDDPGSGNTTEVGDTIAARVRD